MSNLRVALCITELELGGAERCLAELAVRLDRQRFSPTVYSLGPAPADKDRSVLPRLLAAGVEVHCLDGRSSWDFPRTVRRLSSLLAQHETQLVQTFLFHANIVGRLAARWAGVPSTVSGIRVAEREKKWHLRLDRWTDRFVDRHVCVSQAVAQFSAGHGLPPEKLVVIPNGVDFERFGQTPVVPDRPDRRWVTFVGRLDRQKGVPWLLDMAADWLWQVPDVDLLLVGKGPLEPELREQCGRLGILDRVQFAGWRDDVPAVLAASCLLVLPSRWEGMPNVVLEAMAAGLPVVATDVEGVGELLGPAGGEQMAPYGDSAAFSRRVLRLLADAPAAAALGESNRRRAQESFSLDRMVSAYQRLWESLVAAGK